MERCKNETWSLAQDAKVRGLEGIGSGGGLVRLGDEAWTSYRLSTPGRLLCPWPPGFVIRLKFIYFLVSSIFLFVRLRAS